MLKIIIIILSSLLLMACHPSLTREYLLQHPAVLQKELSHCQNGQETGDVCDKVIPIAEEFEKLVNEFGNNPELFGKQILAAEAKSVTLQEELQKAKAAYQKMQAGQGQAADTEIKAAQDKIRQTEVAYQVQVNYVKVLLAVVASMSMHGL